GRLTSVLKASEVWPVTPGEWTTEPLARHEGRVVHSVDQPLIVGRTLPVPREVTQITAGREYRGYAPNRGDFARVLHAVDRLDHLDQHNVVVDRVAIPAGDAAPYLRIEGLPSSAAPLTKRREIGPVPRCHSLLHRVDRGNYYY